MVIAALVSFVLLLLAWLVAPERHAATPAGSAADASIPDADADPEPMPVAA